jgi:hypothetical protein
MVQNAKRFYNYKITIFGVNQVAIVANAAKNLRVVFMNNSATCLPLGKRLFSKDHCQRLSMRLSLNFAAFAFEPSELRRLCRKWDPAGDR